MKNELLIFVLGWLAINTPLLVQLLEALVPVLALLVVGLVIYVFAIKKKGE